jgi:ribonuclease HI
MEKALQLPDDHPRKLAADKNDTKQRHSRNNWRNMADTLSDLLQPQDEERKPLTYHSVPPWQLGIGSAQVFTNLPGIKGRNDDENVKLDAALYRIRELDCSYSVYPDGSASAGTMNGGSGVAITKGDPADPIILEKFMRKGAKHTCSYEEEAEALDIILDWVEEACDPNESVGIFTDSQSLCEALLSFSPDIDQLRFKLKNSKCKIFIQWIPGHSKIPGNDLADELAKQATLIPGPHRPTSFGSICTKIRGLTRDPPGGICHATNSTRDPPPIHERSREVYRCLSKDKERQVSSRSEQTLLAKLRSGHHTSLQEYKNRIDKVTDPICPLCREEEHTLEHWFTKCPATENQRRKLFGEDNGKLECLTKYPLKAAALARQTLGAMC